MASILDSHGFSLDDYSLLDYALHLAIVVEFGAPEASGRSGSAEPATAVVRPEIHDFVRDMASYFAPATRCR